MARAALTFDDEGKAYIYPSDMVVTGMALDPETGILTKTEAGNASITIDLSGEDFTNVTRIDVNVDVTSEGYTDLFWRTIVRSQTEDINGWYTNKYALDYTEKDYQARSGQMKDILMETVYETVGTMKINYICITKNLLSATEGGVYNLKDLPYMVHNGEPAMPFEDKVFEESTTQSFFGITTDFFYGSSASVQQQQGYVDLNDYDELRLYMSDDGVTIRCWFIAATFNVGNPMDDANIETEFVYGNDEGKDYATVNLDEIKGLCGGNAYLIGIKTQGGGKTILNNATLYKEGAVADYIISGDGDMSADVQAALADANATVIDATGLTAPMELESANPNCLFIVNDASQLTNTKNVVVKGADGTYTCSNLVLTAGKPFRAPFEIQVENAYADFNIGDSGWTTLMLPFDADLDDDVFYAYNVAMNEGEVEYTETGLVEANQPILVYAEKGAYELSAKGVTIAATESADLTNGALTGVYTTTANPADSYVLQTANGKTTFSKPEKATNVAPFAAYLTGAAEAVEMPEIIFPVELTFDETGKAYVYPEDMQVTGMTLDTETGLLTKDYTGNAKIFVNLGNTDLSEVVAIKVNVDVDGEGYTDLFWRTSIRSKTEEINNWTGDGKYDIDYTDFQASSEHVASIELQTDYNIMGQMKITSICFMKAEDSEIVDLKDIPYMVKEGDAWNQGAPDWALNCDTSTVYGRGSTVPMFYADLSEYDELRIYQTAGDPVRVFFFNDKSDEFVAGATPESDYYFTVNTTSDPALTVGEEYSTVDLKAIKEKFGAAKLIAIKASAFDTKANVSQLAVVKYPEVIDPDAPFELTFDDEGKAYIYPNITDGHRDEELHR